MLFVNLMASGMKRQFLGWLNIASFVLMVGINTLANVLPINGYTTGGVAALYPNLFTPAGVTFSIWTVIYFLLSGFIVYQWKLFVKQKNFTFRQFSELSLWFILSCFLNAGWIIAWHYLFTALSVVIMLALLFTLARLFLFLETIRRNSIPQKAFIHLPFTLYFAWICVATAANITAFLVSLSWDGGNISPVGWTVIVMVVISLLVAVLTLRYKAAGFAAVGLWSLLGIFIRWKEGEYPPISYTAVVLIVVQASLMIYLLLSKKESLFN